MFQEENIYAFLLLYEKTSIQIQEICTEFKQHNSITTVYKMSSTAVQTLDGLTYLGLVDDGIAILSHGPIRMLRERSHRALQ